MSPQISKIENPLAPLEPVPIYIISGTETIRDIRNSSFKNSIDVDTYINGRLADDVELDVVPQHLDRIVFVPMMGDSDVVRIIAFVALIIIAPAIAGGALFGWGFAAGLPYIIGTAAIVMVGGMLINALLPPAQPAGYNPDFETERSQVYGWSPQTVQRQGLSLPKYYGKNKLHGNVIATWMAVDWDTDESPAKSITAITKANPGKVTVTAHGYSTGAIIFIYDVGGMTEVNRRTYKITKVDNDNFTIGIDTTDYTAYTSGGTARYAMGKRQTVYAIIALNEGVIESLNDMKLNDKDVDFLDDVTIEEKRGLTDQTSLSDFDELKIERSILSKVRNDGSPKQYVTIGDFFDHLEIEVAFPSGIHDNLGNHTIGYKIETREYPHGSWSTLIDCQHTDNRADVFRVNHRLYSTDRNQKYEVKLTKTTADDDGALVADDLFLGSVREVLDVAMKHPKTALVGVKALATDQLSGNIRFSCIAECAVVMVYQDHSDSIEGISKAASAVITMTGHSFVEGDYILITKVKGMAEINNKVGRVTATAANTVTVNIDSTDFSTYTSGGVCWKFSIEYNNNPAWVLFDILTQPVLVSSSPYDVERFDGMEPSRIDLVTFQEWADWCDKIIDIGDAGIEIDDITKAVQAHILTSEAHNFEVGDIIVFENISGMTEIVDGTTAEVVSVTSETEFVIDLDTSGYTAFPFRADKLHIQFEGEDESQDFVDLSPKAHSITAIGDAEMDTAQKKWGVSSGYFSGAYATGGALQLADSADWDVCGNNSDDWTIDFWARPQDVWGRWIAAHYENIDNNWRMYFDDGGVSFRMTSGTVLKIDLETADDLVGDEGSWYHITLAKVGNKYGIYINGIQKAYVQDDDIDTFDGYLYIGAFSGGVEARYKGHIDEFRICHSNKFSAAPNVGLTDTIDIPTLAYSPGLVAKVEKRIKFDGGFDRDTSVWEAALQVCEIGRAILIRNGIELTLAIDKAGDPVQMFTVGNISRDTFKEAFLPTADRASELEIHFRDARQNYERTVLNFFNAAIDNPTNKLSIEQFGCTSASQARRSAEQRLRQNQLLIRTIEFEAEIDAIASTVGDVVYVQHDVTNWGKLEGDAMGGGRVVTATDSTVTLDRDIEDELDPGNTYEIMVRLEDDTIETKTISSVSGKVVTISGTFSGTVKVNDLWAVGKEDIAAKLYRIIGIKKTGEQSCSIKAIEYNANVYQETCYS